MESLTRKGTDLLLWLLLNSVILYPLPRQCWYQISGPSLAELIQKYCTPIPGVLGRPATPTSMRLVPTSLPATASSPKKHRLSIWRRRKLKKQQAKEMEIEISSVSGLPQV